MHGFHRSLLVDANHLTSFLTNMSLGPQKNLNFLKPFGIFLPSIFPFNIGVKCRYPFQHLSHLPLNLKNTANSQI